jgi:glutathione synthetase
MRKDPPFDPEYIYATHLLEQAEREGARVFNRPRALRDHPEKLAILEFPQHIAPTLVTRDADDVRRFHAAHGEIILKPLDGMGGMGIFRVGPDGLNLGSITETLNHHGATTLMVQKFLPEIAQGDKRILVIDGVPVPYSLARIPQGSEIRGNLAAGGKGVAMPLTDADRRIAEAIGPLLAGRGLLLVGLDVIGECRTEINGTSPTCFQEITQQTMNPGDRLTLGGYTMEYNGLYDAQAEDGRRMTIARATVYQDGEAVAQIRPRRDTFYTFDSITQTFTPTTNMSIHGSYSTLASDFYAIITFWEGNTTTFRVYLNPLINFVWLGGVVLIIGTLVALWPSRQPAARVQYVPAAAAQTSGDR